MPAEPFQALHAGRHRRPSERKPVLVVAGAGGALGTEVLRRLAGQHRFEATWVLAREPITAGLRAVAALLVPDAPCAQWEVTPADTGLVMFDPPRLFNDRERALWTPQPEQLTDVAAWMRRGGVRTLLVVLPHDAGRLPEALKRGLASLDEQSVAALGFERLLIIRTARKPVGAGRTSVLQGLAHWMLSIMKYMIPSREQPVRAMKVAEFVTAALDLAPPGVHVAASEQVWAAAQQRDPRQAVRTWLGL